MNKKKYWLERKTFETFKVSMKHQIYPHPESVAIFFNRLKHYNGPRDLRP